MKSLFIVDSMALIFKSYYAMINNPLKSPSGFPTSAIYGFYNQLFKIIETYKPEYLILTYDAKEKTFRHEEYEQYKSSRIKIPEDLIPQIEKIKELNNLLQIPSIIKPGYEADDIIGSLSNYFSQKNVKCYIISPDKDLLQLINRYTFIIRPKNDDIQLYDIDKFVSEFNFEPQYMVDYLALVGDASDDIPGVKGLGPKTVQPLIEKYKTIENLYDHIDELANSVKNKLLENKENAFLSKKLATIHKEIELPFDIEFYKLKKIDIEPVINELNTLGIKNIQTKIFEYFRLPSTHIRNDVNGYENNYNEIEIKSKDELNSLKKKLPLLFSLRCFLKDDKNYIIGIDKLELAFDNTTKYVIKISNDNLDLFGNSIDNNSITNNEIKDLLEYLNYKSNFVITDSAKNIYKAYYFFDIQPQFQLFDIPLAHYLLAPEASRKIYDISQSTLKISINETSFNNYQILYYQQITQNLITKLKENNLQDLLKDIEIPLAKVLANIENNGIRIDLNILKELKNNLRKEILKIENNIYKLAGQIFNINSPKQLQEILFQKLNLKPVTKSKTGYSTDAQVLEELKNEHPIIEQLINYRTYTKLLNTYIETLPEYISKETDKIHAQINQNIAATGRLSISNPNLQNIPIRTDIGREIRKAFIPYDSNSVLISADYSQIELRILAHFSKDKVLVTSFQNNLDIHTQTASELYGVNINDVTPEMRRAAKTINFGIIYGLGPYGLKTRLNISNTEAKEIISKYFKKFSGIFEYIEETKKFAKENKFTQTLFNRKRFFENIDSKNKILASYEERAAINHPIQGTAADLIKKAMIELQNFIISNNYQTKIILQIHDELLFNVPNNEIDIMKSQIKYIMENTVHLSVPLLVEVGVGNNWYEAH
ncbi:MAG TPA: DNA polymerase I [Ignavibacteriales bacterium]|nr:DNA polymerase I [Ignavibacteriales bacterium]